MTCVETKRERDLRIWRNMTPAQRDYDRLVARRIPQGATWGAETAAGQAAEAERDRRMDDGSEPEGCSCHLSAPCGWCVVQDDTDTDLAPLLAVGEGV